jgi:hypothetical protein
MTNRVKVLFLAQMFSALYLNAKVEPFTAERLILARLGDVAAGHSSASPIAFEALQRVAMNDGDKLGAEAATLAGIRPERFRELAFTFPPVRAYALRKIGETGLAEAVDFLSKLTPAAFGEDVVQQIWPSAQIALQEAKLNQIPDRQAKSDFLEQTIQTSFDAMSNGAVHGWAENELCNAGTLTSLPVIQESIRNRDPSSRGEEEVQFCEARIEVIRRSPNRIAALATALRVAEEPQDEKLVRWAFYQLADMNLASADAELERFAAEIGRLAEDSPLRQSLRVFLLELRGVHEKREAMKRLATGQQAVQ